MIDTIKRPKAKMYSLDKKIQSSLLKYPEITFAYLHGSTLTSENPKDVDIAVYLDDGAFGELYRRGEVHMAFAIPLEIALEKTTGIKVDIQVLNRAPLSFRHRVVQQGRLILDRLFEVRSQFEYLSRYPYFDFKHRRTNYLEEALS
jgi:predicted nucleotidyltransferase